MTVEIKARVSDDTAAQVKALAQQRGMSVNQLLVSAMDRELMAEAAIEYNEICRQRNKDAEITRWKAHRTQIKAYQQ